MPPDAAPITIDIPHGMPCPRCQYSIGGQSDPICPECGLVVTTTDIAHSRAAKEIEAGLGRLLWRRAQAGLIVCVTCSLGAMGMILLTTPRDQLLPSGLAGFIVPALAMGGSVATGFVWSRLVHPRDRWVCLAVWLRELPRLHIPWLVAPLIAAVLFIMAKSSRQSSDAMLATMLPVMSIPWGMLSIFAISRALARQVAGLRSAGADKPRAVLLLVCITLFIGAGAMLTGVAASIFSAGCAYRLMLPP